MVAQDMKETIAADISGEVPGELIADAEQPVEPSGTHIKFGTNSGFHATLRRRVDDYFQRTGRRQRDCPAMYVKTAILLTWCIGSYVLLVFVAAAWWQAVPLAISLGLSLAAIGFNVQHDGRHQAYSDRAWVNRLMAWSLDLMGGSSYVWGWKHNVVHHTYVNVTGHDSDIDLGVVGRLSPHQKRHEFHRFQHWYLWVLYGLVAVKWQLYDDFRDVLRGRLGGYRFPRPRGWALAAFCFGKALFVFLAFVVPLLLHPLGTVLLLYAVVAGVTGVVLSVVFQLAHCVGEASFPMPAAGTSRLERDWAVHQVETSVDFAPHSRLATWFLGGLNYQIEHHLFPRICHVHYPALAVIVEQTCREFGIRYAVHERFSAAIAAHYRWLRQMGMAPASASAC